MDYDPLSEVIDENLSISQETLDQLTTLRQAVKFIDLPGADIQDEQDRLSNLLNSLLDVLISSVSENQTKLWVMKQFKKVLDTVSVEDTEARDHFGMYLEDIMDIFHIESSDGVIGFYL